MFHLNLFWYCYKTKRKEKHIQNSFFEILITLALSCRSLIPGPGLVVIFYLAADDDARPSFSSIIINWHGYMDFRFCMFLLILFFYSFFYIWLFQHHHIIKSHIRKWVWTHLATAFYFFKKNQKYSPYSLEIISDVSKTIK